MGRRYTLRQRAREQEETRRRIIAATIELHQSVGDNGTTITGIAERAGVGRATVYRHFPDERALLSACTSHYLAENPPPNPVEWASIQEPAARLRVALAKLYAWYRANEPMLARAEEDAPTNPMLAELLAPLEGYRADVRELLMQGSERPDGDSGDLLRAAIGHALAFGTWRSLAVDQGLADTDAVALMTRLVDCASTPARS